MIRAARERAEEAGADIVLDVATAACLPFAPGQFDLVTAITILCFVEDASPAVRAIARVLRPGGRLVRSSWAAGPRIRAWLGRRLWRQGQFRTAKELRDLAAEAGLVVQQVRGAIYYPRWDRAARLLSRWDTTWAELRPLGLAL
jgi:SAM-dependent methyltransferase